MKTLIAALVGATLVVAPLTASARGGGGGGFGGGFHGAGGGGFHGSGGAGFHGGGHGFSDGRGGRGFHDHDFGGRRFGGRGFGFDDGFFLGADLGLGFGFYDDAWLYGYPGYYGYDNGYDDRAAPSRSETRKDAAAKYCGRWRWDAAANNYQWTADAC